MTTLLSAKEARNTTIFVIENGEITQTNLFDHVVKSAEETTSPRGIENKMFVKEVSGVIYRLINSEKEIDEIEYDGLSEEEQDNYEYYGEATIRWELREWLPNGKSQLIDTYESEEAADDEWYTRTYNYDFTPDDQRDTSYWLTMKEARMESVSRVLSNSIGKLADVTTYDRTEAAGIVTEKNNELFISVGHQGEVSISIEQIRSIDNIEEE